jgi:hypothetical protein
LQDIQTCPQLYQKIVSKVMKVIDDREQARPALPDRVLMSPVKAHMSPVKSVAV